jgi:RNA polymerase sigma factor (sigma-70 family)
MSPGTPRHSNINRGMTVGTEAMRSMAEGKSELVERLFVAHRGALQAFFLRRVRQRSDASDLAQEVYLRMLRVKDTTAIHDTEAYLYSVASNLAKEHAASSGRRGVSVDVADATIEEQLAQLPSFEGEILTAQQMKRLRVVLRGLPPRCHAAVVLQYVHGQSHQQIAERLQVSPRMVKQYVAQALGLCRRRMASWG